MRSRIQRTTAPTIKKRTSPAAAQSEDSILRLQRLIGNRATLNLLQRQGSLSVTASSDDTETAADNSLTKQVLADQSAGTLESKFKQGADAPFRDRTHLQHPGFAEMGIRPGEIRGEKSALLIGNSQYQHVPVLPGVQKDIENAKVPVARERYVTHVKRDLTAADLRSSYSEKLKTAQPGDAVFLFYAGHGFSPGLLGVDGEPIMDSENIDWKNTATVKGKTRTVPFTGIAKYSDVMPELEAAAGRGVHVSFIIDACYAGTATDLVRRHAIEKIASVDNPRVKATYNQIKRLEELKTLAQNPPPAAPAPDAAAAPDTTTSRGFTVVENTTPDPRKALWDTQIYPELQTVSAYLAQEGVMLNIPAGLPDYRATAIEQQINRAINALIDLAEKLEEDQKKPVTPDVAPPA